MHGLFYSSLSFLCLISCVLLSFLMSFIYTYSLFLQFIIFPADSLLISIVHIFLINWPAIYLYLSCWCIVDFNCRPTFNIGQTFPANSLLFSTLHVLLINGQIFPTNSLLFSIEHVLLINRSSICILPFFYSSIFIPFFCLSFAADSLWPSIVGPFFINRPAIYSC